MALTISVRFITGSYQGRSPTGQTETFPGTDRLYSALVAAAGSGPYAEEHDGRLVIVPRHRAALEWLEQRPPSSLSVPDALVNAPSTVAYRGLGLLKKGAYAAAQGKDAVARSALAGPVMWRWDDQPDEGVMEAVKELCAEVAYVGEASSLAVVEATTSDITFEDELRLVPEDDPFPFTAVPVTTPLPGRVQALEAAYASSRSRSKGKEKPPAKDESDEVAPWTDAALDQLWYRPTATPAKLNVPWDKALVIEVTAGQGTTWPPAAADLVSWAVTLHRALVRALDPAVPPLVTGHYGEGMQKPANRLAIQVVDRSMPLGFSLGQGHSAAFALLLPKDTTPADQDAVVRGIYELTKRSLYAGKAGRLTLERIIPVEGSGFWSPPAPGTTRWWRPWPLAIADTRPIRRGGGASWSLRDSVYLAVGMVWRDLPRTSTGRRATFYTELAESVASEVRIASLEQMVGPDLDRFVHRIGKDVLLTGYRALLRMPALADDRAPVAIGQSRHLGTGLLVPVDLPDEPEPESVVS